MEHDNFDPFTHRKDRDIRNGLSSAFAHCLKTKDFAPVERLAEKFLENEASDLHRNYINDRVNRYRNCLNLIHEHVLKTVLEQSFVLWDEELFFEMHEVLEEIWMTAKGREKAALQGLIRAAGVYVQLPSNGVTGAQKMAAKAVIALEENHSALPFLPGLDLLLNKLRKCDPVPPKLYNKKGLQ